MIKNFWNQTGELRWFHNTGQVADRKIMDVRMKGFYAYSCDLYSRPANTLRLPQ